MRVRIACIAFLAAVALAGCRKSSQSAYAQTPPPPQEVQWNRNQSAATAPAVPVQYALASAQVTVNGSGVTAHLSNVHPGTELTLAWFGPDGWNVTNESQVASGETITFAVPKFGSAGRYEAELLNGTQLLGTIDVNA